MEKILLNFICLILSFSLVEINAWAGPEEGLDDAIENACHLKTKEIDLIIRLGTYALIESDSLDDADLTNEKRLQKFKALGVILSENGLPFRKITGAYQGRLNSYSYFVWKPEHFDLTHFRRILFQLGRNNQQESVILSSAGSVQLVFTSGPNIGRAYSGSGFSDSVGSNYSIIPGIEGEADYTIGEYPLNKNLSDVIDEFKDMLDPNGIPVPDPSRIHFEWEDEKNRSGLQVTITTSRLVIRSTRIEDIPAFVRLFSDPILMKRFEGGGPRDTEKIIKRVKEVWIPRWKENDPRSALSVFLKEDLKNQIAFVALGIGEGPGRSEISYIFFKEFWGRGLALEAATALVKVYAPWLIKMKYDFARGFPDCPATLLTTIDATAHPDNVASCKILDKLGFACAKPELKILSEEDPIPEAGAYTIRVKDEVTGVVRTRTAEKKYGVMKWHFTLEMPFLGGSL